ncbi:Gem-associated protein 2 like protein [Argiope bruennichi]|uniref:Gem-associated protein 2 n=1 Tax=Argiope bruennichi TaxID=94029 RepID=A0A8T0EVQ8_ARGBR|nr:Gem-associated protein 2 like protein [Argiope bruennichi]
MSGDDNWDEAYGLVQKALFVQRPTRRIDLNTEPRDGNEYIHKSRLENANLKFHDSEIVEHKFSDENEQELLKQWARKKALEFSYHASAMAVDDAKLYLKKKFPKKFRFPHNNRTYIQEWCTFCLGSKLCSKIYEKEYEEPIDEIEGHSPLLSIVVHFDQHRVFTVLHFLHEWFLSLGMEESLGSWIYALLACIRKPLNHSCKEFLEIFYNDCVKRLEDCDESEERSRLYMFSTIFNYYFHINSD